MAAMCARVLSGSPPTHVESGLVGTSEHWRRAEKVSQARGAGMFILLIPSPWVGSECPQGSTYGRPSHLRHRGKCSLGDLGGWLQLARRQLSGFLGCRAPGGTLALTLGTKHLLLLCFLWPAVPHHRDTCLVQTADSCGS